MLQGVRVVLNHTSARVLTFSLKFSLSSIFAKDIVAGALEQLRRADVIKYCVHLAHYSFKQDRESLYKRGKDWSLSSCGGYADDFDPLPRPDCVLGKYGRIFPTFHLTEDAMDFDSGVRLDIVHREGGSFMELHSFEGREKIEKAAEIFAKSIPGFNPNLEWWDGAPEDRWLE